MTWYWLFAIWARDMFWQIQTVGPGPAGSPESG